MFAENLDVFFNTADFAIAATYNGAATINVIFDRPNLDVLGVAGTNPVALAKASDVPSDAVGKTLQIGADVWTIQNVQPQDDGAVVLLQLRT